MFVLCLIYRLLIPICFNTFMFILCLLLKLDCIQSMSFRSKMQRNSRERATVKNSARSCTNVFYNPIEGPSSKYSPTFYERSTCCEQRMTCCGWVVFVARLYDFQPKMYVSSRSVFLSVQYKLKRHLKYSHVWIEMYIMLCKFYFIVDPNSNLLFK